VIAVLVVAIVGWGIYRRVRRSFGRQAVQVGRLRFRVGILATVGTLVLSASAANGRLLAALLGGVACGAVLGSVGLRHTKFEATQQGRFYTPHTYIGLFVTALFVARILFRFLTLYAHGPAPAPNANPFGQMQWTPATLAIFGLLIGYYVLFNLGVLRRSRELSLDGTQIAAADAPVSSQRPDSTS
jgi:hypothetical protein